jgi:hypothetical protein
MAVIGGASVECQTGDSVGKQRPDDVSIPSGRRAGSHHHSSELIYRQRFIGHNIGEFLTAVSGTRH